MANPMKEPTADQREGAAQLFGMFNAMLLEGFTETQALTILGHMLSAGGSKS
jgi:hypothetical protein